MDNTKIVATRPSRVLTRSFACFAASLLLAASAAGQTRVQDLCTLQGQRENRLMGYGLVVGLSGSGDGHKDSAAMRALMSLHRKYEQPIFDLDELQGNNSVALVLVEAAIPEFGAREGQKIDVIVSVRGAATSLKNGQLLMTPLQDATLTIHDIQALAGGRIDLPDEDSPTRGIIRGGAVVEADFFYSFIRDGAITLVLHDVHAGFPMARMVAKAINIEERPPVDTRRESVLFTETFDDVERTAVALGPKNVRVMIPMAERARPAAFISRVLETEIFDMPQQPARVLINRKTKTVSLTGTVVIAPTILQIPGLGTVSVGAGQSAASGAVGLDTEKTGGVKFDELLVTLSAMQLTGDQLIAAVEQLHRTGTLRARLIYTE